MNEENKEIKQLKQVIEARDNDIRELNLKVEYKTDMISDQQKTILALNITVSALKKRNQELLNIGINAFDPKEKAPEKKSDIILLKETLLVLFGYILAKDIAFVRSPLYKVVTDIIDPKKPTQ